MADLSELMESLETLQKCWSLANIVDTEGISPLDRNIISSTKVKCVEVLTWWLMPVTQVGVIKCVEGVTMGGCWCSGGTRVSMKGVSWVCLGFRYRCFESGDGFNCCLSMLIFIVISKVLIHVFFGYWEVEYHLLVRFSIYLRGFSWQSFC